MATEYTRSITLEETPPTESPIARHRTYSEQLMEAAKALVREGQPARASDAS